MRIIIYTKDNCVQCNATKNALDKKGIDYQLINLDHEPAHAETLRSLGYRQVPVVVAEQEHWSGFRPDKILALSHAATVRG
ncbi:glutaredoxin-like protein NrdH [Erwinia pyrifoliae]|uniref:Glutaredoxin-like protein NrdH n=1 Tax=Erwinia pyrifoliae TaxID=79967 RepID=A0ABY5XA76_ERWPY|nr:glutaredoxin-like protein NrdH [Erwinia pyrifoliae]AUX73523.1 NrdH-redoxin [Erwinia pyrifoliae]MCA8876176.1 glutaredoxin-like protein NrdH [Erwinia pyrifoliae]MCT2386316.1 glutaredoxin-like protein NrdH [Erwinia pyrifoliae]MCU8588087.1 glutaredoxin-like protein NrdH [Erwinia pyrifoliae]UWS28484.1 glutaredoxin-like protein NrdH [Erwinia pyrifoliae]